MATAASGRLVLESYQYDCVSLVPALYTGYYVDVDTSEFLSSGNGTGKLERLVFYIR